MSVDISRERGQARSKFKKERAGANGGKKRGSRGHSQTNAEAELKRETRSSQQESNCEESKVKYEPRKHSIKDVRAWEVRHKRLWAELTVEERIAANEEITAQRAKLK